MVKIKKKADKYKNGKSKNESKSENVLKNVIAEENPIQKKKRKPKKKKNILPNPEELVTQILTDGNEDAKPGSDPLQGFKVIKWKTREESDAVHNLFVKKHIVPITELTKAQAKPQGRTILCHNVPPYLNETHITTIFRQFGNVAKVYIHQKPTADVPAKRDVLFLTDKDMIKGFKVAYIVFSDVKFVKEILEMDADDVKPVVLKKKPQAGIKHWIQQYNNKIVPTAELEKSVKKFMENFDKDELRRKEMEKNSGEADEDGWVTVTRTGKRQSGGLVRSETMEQRLRARKRRQEKQLLNITPAQVKESKMKQMIELKKKFEEDKQRIALMKQQRKFKPFQ